MQSVKNILLQDCTLRDGGMGIEDAAKRGSSTAFSALDIKKLTECLVESQMDIVEIGSIEISKDDKRKYATYQSSESASEMMPKGEQGQLYTVLYRGPDTPIEDIPSYRESLCGHVRVILRYSQLKKSLDFCKALAKKGYRVFIQPALTTWYSQEELQAVFDTANDIDAFAAYFTDSHGYMDSSDVRRLFEIYHKSLKPQIRIGFHAHNNKNLAFSNSLLFLSLAAGQPERDIVLDSCIMGLGRGGGNLQTEIIADHLMQACGKKYNYAAILDACEVIDRWAKNEWGYSVANFIPARHRAAYKYGLDLRDKYHLPYREIDAIIANLPHELKQRCIDDALNEILQKREQAGLEKST